LFDRANLAYVVFGLDALGYLALVVLSVGIYTIGNYMQIFAVRAIGASNHSASNSLRLVSAAIGSAFFLGEPLGSSTSLVGLSVILVAIFAYWFSRKFGEWSAPIPSAPPPPSSSSSSIHQSHPYGGRSLYNPSEDSLSLEEGESRHDEQSAVELVGGGTRKYIYIGDVAGTSPKKEVAYSIVPSVDDD
jgi:hypothetical protein